MDKPTKTGTKQPYTKNWENKLIKITRDNKPNTRRLSLSQKKPYQRVRRKYIILQRKKGKKKEKRSY